MTRWLVHRFTRGRHLLVEATVACCLAFSVWLYLQTRAHQTLEHVQIPVIVQVAASQRDHYFMEISSVPKATVSFSGPSSRMRELKKKLYRSQIQAVVPYVVPEDKQKESTFSDVANIEQAKVNLPPGIVFEWHEVNRTVAITVHRLVERTLPVRLDHTGDVRVSQIKIEPATVTVRGPKAVLDRAQAISTLPFELTVPPAPAAGEEPKETLTSEGVELVTELEGRTVQVTPGQVQFKAKVMPRKRIYDIVDLPIRFAIPDQFPWQARFADNHGKLSLRIIGPAGEDVPRVRAYIDLSQETFGQGRNVGPVRIELPKDFELVERRTPMAAFYMDENRPVEYNAARPNFDVRPVSQPKLP